MDAERSPWPLPDSRRQCSPGNPAARSCSRRLPKRAMRFNASRKCKGFTLLEVLIGLLVLSLALFALSRTAAIQVSNFDALRERTLAGWLAADVLERTRLTTPFPPDGKSDGERRFGGRDWHWQLIVQDTPVPSLRRLDVRVYLRSDRSTPMATLTGFSGTDLQP